MKNCKPWIIPHRFSRFRFADQSPLFLINTISNKLKQSKLGQRAALFTKTTWPRRQVQTCAGLKHVLFSAQQQKRQRKILFSSGVAKSQGGGKTESLALRQRSKTDKLPFAVRCFQNGGSSFPFSRLIIQHTACLWCLKSWVLTAWKLMILLRTALVSCRLLLWALIWVP